MLVLSRRLQEKIVFPAINAKVQVVSVKSGVVRLGIEAPPEIAVLREELPDRAREWGKSAAAPAAQTPGLPDLMNKRLKVTALGLSLLRRQLQEGCVEEAQNTLDKIEEDLQLLRGRLDREGASPKPRNASRPTSRPRKALLVEDDNNECELLAGFLRLAGLDVVTATDGAAALNYLNSQGRPDVMLLDMVLPRCDGPTTVREVRRNPALAGMKIYAVTGHTPERFHMAVGSDGVDRWFQKPVNPEALLKDLCATLEPTNA